MFKVIIRTILNKLGYGVYKLSQAEIDKSLKLKWIVDKEIKTILDIGANSGQAAGRFRRYFPEAMIYSFEPLPDCYKQLTAAFLNDNKFKAFNVALGDSTGTAKFNRNEYSLSSSLLPLGDAHKKSFPFAQKETPENVCIRRLDDMVSELCIEGTLLVKLDVQGFEDKVIEGGKKLIEQADILICEMSIETLYERQVLFDGIYKKFKSMGFKYAGNFEQLLSPQDGRVLQVDGIFIKNNN